MARSRVTLFDVDKKTVTFAKRWPRSFRGLLCEPPSQRRCDGPLFANFLYKAPRSGAHYRSQYVAPMARQIPFSGGVVALRLEQRTAWTRPSYNLVGRSRIGRLSADLLIKRCPGWFRLFGPYHCTCRSLACRTATRGHGCNRTFSNPERFHDSLKGDRQAGHPRPGSSVREPSGAIPSPSA